MWPNSPIATPLKIPISKKNLKTQEDNFTYVDSATDALQRTECNDLLEEIEQIVTSGSAREERDGGVSWP